MEELNKIVELINSIKEKNQALGDILAYNFNISLKEYQTLVDNKPLDVSEKILMVSEILGVNIEEMIKNIISKRNECKADPQLEEFIKSDQAPEKFSEEEFQEFLKDIQK